SASHWRKAAGAAAPSAGASARTSSSSAGGRLASRLVTRGWASMPAAWLSVIPVRANSSMPIRQIAELIQCHWCNCLSQKDRRRAGLEGLPRMMPGDFDLSYWISKCETLSFPLPSIQDRKIDDSLFAWSPSPAMASCRPVYLRVRRGRGTAAGRGDRSYARLRRRGLRDGGAGRQGRQRGRVQGDARLHDADRAASAATARRADAPDAP